MRDEDLAALQAAGIYDPAAPKAEERLALIEWLASQGANVEQMIDAARVRTLTGLAGDLYLRSGQRMTLAEVAAAAGMPVERIEKMRVAVGLPPTDPEERSFSSQDTTIFQAFDQAALIFGEEALIQFMRVVGSSLARIAEAAVSLFLVNIEGPILETRGGELKLAQANLEVVRSFDMVAPLVNRLLRTHLELAIQRMRNARERGSVDLVRLAVGFVDLVGFTSRSRNLSARELADLVAHFEGLAHDVITLRNGRLVKLIGDEVMFVARDAACACDIAVTLVRSFTGNPSITPHGGLAVGPMLMRSGDYYGPIVNLASRIAEVAVPLEVLVTHEVVQQAGEQRFRFEPAGKRMIRGFDEPIALYTVLMR